MGPGPPRSGGASSGPPIRSTRRRLGASPSAQTRKALPSRPTSPAFTAAVGSPLTVSAARCVRGARGSRSSAPEWSIRMCSSTSAIAATTPRTSRASRSGWGSSGSRCSNTGPRPAPVRRERRALLGAVRITGASRAGARTFWKSVLCHTIFGAFVRWSGRDARTTFGRHGSAPGVAMPRSEPDGSREGPPGGRDPRGERHPSGWRVRPGPDGRGAPPPPRPRGFGPGLLIFFLMLLLINIALTSTLQTQPTRVRIPYSPTFLDAGERGQRELDLLEGNDGPGRFPQRGALSGQHGDTGQAVRDRAAGVHRRQGAAGATAVQGCGDQREIAIDGHSVVLDDLVELRAGAADRVACSCG